MTTPSQRIAVLERSLERTRRSQEKAEDLLETKSRELFLAHEKTKKSFTYLRDILDSIRDGVLITDGEGKIIQTNPAGRKMLCLSPDELKGRSIEEFFELEKGMALSKSEGDLDGVPKHLWDLLSVSTGTLNERLLKSEKGDLISVSLSSSVLRDDTGAVEAIVFSVRNTHKNRELLRRLESTRRNLENANAKLKQQQAMLVQQEKMSSLGVMAAGIAHEINNPVGFMLSNLQTLHEYLEDFKNYFDEIEKSQAKAGGREEMAELLDDTGALLKETEEGASRIRGIVKGLKDFVHTDEQEEWKEVDLNQALKSTLNIVWNELKYKVEVVEEFTKIPMVNCMAGQLNQVFLNILVNAGQAIEEKGYITLRTSHEDRQVIVQIQDTGCGIPKDILERLFDPFFTTKKVGEGTGLGLSISKGIVEKHGGQIKVVSEVGEGTCFEIRLPVGQ